MTDNRQEKPESRYCAIVVLANLMDNHGRLNAESRARIDAAIKAFKAKEAPCIITSGWAYREDCAIPIAEPMRDYATSHGVPPEAIIADTDSRDTVGDAVFSKRNITVPKGWKRLLVVTSDYHVERTREIFTFIYGPGYTIDVRGAASDPAAALAESEQRSLQVFRSTFEGVTAGDDAAILERLRQRHPFYNGAIHPKI